MGDPARLMGGEDKRKEEFSIRDCIGSFKQHQTFAHPQSLFATPPLQRKGFTHTAGKEDISDAH